MYIPQHFEETRTEVMHALMRAHPLATLVTLSSEGITANHIPLLLSETTLGCGVLQGHIARANPLWQDLASHDVMAIFQGADAYISPSWYPGKQEHGKVVPTWNYAVVHARAKLRVIDDADWLQVHLTNLTATHEAAFSQPWAVSDAPGDFIERLVGNLIGIELSISTLSGKWKVSQNQSVANRDGVMQGLQARGTENDLLMTGMIQNSSKTAD
jgi:transcriptional regulator